MHPFSNLMCKTTTTFTGKYVYKTAQNKALIVKIKCWQQIEKQNPFLKALFDLTHLT